MTAEPLLRKLHFDICVYVQIGRNRKSVAVSAEKQANTLRVLGDATRLRLAVLLAARGEICVCHLAEALGEPDFKVSRHLGVMRASGLVEVRRQGVWKHYRLAELSTPFGRAIVQLLQTCLEEIPAMQTDLQRCDDASCGSAELSLGRGGGRNGPDSRPHRNNATT